MRSRPFGELFAIPSRNGLTRPKRVRGAGVKMVNMGELFANARLLNVPMDRVPLEQKERADNLLKEGDLLFARQSLVRSGAGQSSIFLGDDEDVCFESHLIRCRLDVSLTDPQYYFYWFRSPEGRNAIDSIVEQGAGAAGIRGSDLAKLMVPFPDLHVQKAVSEQLAALDDKIELNRRMNVTLEAMAQALFKEWFVDGAKAEWEEKTIGEVADLNAWTLGKNDSLDVIDYIEISEVDRGNINVVPRYNRGEEPSRARRRLQHGDTALSTVRPDRGCYFLAMHPSECMVASTGFAVVTPKAAPWSFIHAALTQPEVSTYLGQHADGGAYPAVRPEIIGAYTVPWPTEEDILDKFHEVVGPLYERAHHNRTESSTLAALRDMLLPKLMRGEVRVKNAIAQ